MPIYPPEEVNVVEVSPGTGATNLGKAEDSAHTTGDVGVMALGVRKDVLSGDVAADGDYTQLTTDRFGCLVVSELHNISTLTTLNAGGTVGLEAGTNAIGKLAANSGVDIGDVTLTAGTAEVGYVGSRQVNGVIKDDAGTDSTVKVAHLDMTTATTTDIVPAVAGRRIRVLEYHINFLEITGTSVSFARGAGTTRCTGSPLHASASAAGALKSDVTRAAPAGAFLFETADSEALRVTNSAAADISVAVVYIEVL